ncbi:thiamine diphosphokinase [Bartonella sp. TP]|uniref:thiamine diphosphokinase n=1 Tax=Bartonella sp. TP TaxID=3057550 RepID=UPI0025B02584|nr:thiamine diphosphokinase [Bartonella sp. TP]MDN5248496.1 thiamine diphosphokinase [Alphaproteobacteria bacterium]WJW79579.1 thiamine diphosphokinase [Bartonella sp. TP]
MGAYTILLGGDLVATPRLREQVKHSKLVAADSGIKHVAALNMKPSLWVGDFDSCTPQELEKYSGVEKLSFPSSKDKTDGQIAIEAALSNGATELILCGAFGGPRLDHCLAHIAMCMALTERGIKVLLTSGNQEGRALLPGATIYDWPVGTQFSIIGLSKLDGLAIEGAEWSIDNLQPLDIDFGSTHTLSNIVRGTLKLQLSLGKAVIVAALNQ